jgi:hypothetical protein
MTAAIVAGRLDRSSRTALQVGRSGHAGQRRNRTGPSTSASTTSHGSRSQIVEPDVEHLATTLRAPSHAITQRAQTLRPPPTLVTSVTPS